jgi:predicted nucleic acid-binding protein
MILVDSSVWIELLNGRMGRTASPDDLLWFATCGPVAQEVFQGLRETADAAAFRDAFLSLPVLSDPLPSRLYLEAAEIYRHGRKRGYSIRSSVDCLIAAIAIENRVSVWHRDRDFTAIARFTNLAVLHVT